MSDATLPVVDEVEGDDVAGDDADDADDDAAAAAAAAAGGGEHDILGSGVDGFYYGLDSCGWRTKKLCRQLNLEEPLIVTIATEGSLGLAIGTDKREGSIIAQFITAGGLIKQVAPHVGRGDTILAINDEVFPPFQFFDVDNDGAVELKEMKSGIEESGRELSPEEIDEIVASMDVDGDGYIDFASFSKWMTSFEVQRLMTRMKELPRPICFTIAQKEENKVAVDEAADAAEEQEEQDPPDEDVSRLSELEQFHIENANRSEMSDAFKSAVKNSRAETKRAMRSLGSEAPLSESSQLLLEVEANHAVDHEEEYAYSTEFMISKKEKERKEEAAFLALQKSRRAASSKSSSKKSDEGSDGARKPRMRRKKKGEAEPTISDQDGLVLSSLLSDARKEYDAVVSFEDYDRLSKVGRTALTVGRKRGGGAEREAKRLAVLEAKEKRRQQKILAEGGSSSSNVEELVRKPFPLVDVYDAGASGGGTGDYELLPRWTSSIESSEMGAVNPARTPAQFTEACRALSKKIAASLAKGGGQGEREPSISDAANIAVAAASTARAGIVTVARGGLQSWVTEREALVQRLATTQDEQRRAEDAAMSTTFRVTRYSDLIARGGATRTSRADAAAHNARQQRSADDDTREATVARGGVPQSQSQSQSLSQSQSQVQSAGTMSRSSGEIEAGIFHQLATWRGQHLSVAMPGVGASTRAGNGPSGAAAATALPIVATVAAPREAQAPSRDIRYLTTRADRYRITAAERAIDDDVALRFDALVALELGKRPPRVHAAQRPRPHRRW